jgi:hypothetical protein
MKSPDLLFLRLLRELRPSVAKEGFRRHSQNFVIEGDACWCVINFQKGLCSLANEKRFTVNVTIAAKRVLRFYGDPSDKPPRHWKCHWQNRIGHYGLKNFESGPVIIRFSREPYLPYAALAAMGLRWKVYPS